MKPCVAILEDDLSLLATLRRGLSEEGYVVVTAVTGSELVQRVEDEAPDVLVIDIGLPDGDGRDVCQAIRARGIRAPVLFLTARGALVDRLSGFRAGGDDYLVKPFPFEELVARLGSLLRRSPPDSRAAAVGLALDPVHHAVTVGERSSPLTPTEFRLLGALAARPGEVLRRRELVAAAWPEGGIVNDNTLDAYVARLRRKLRDLDQGEAIVTVHGVGYRLR